MPRLAEADEVENLEFKWGKKRGVDGKKNGVQFYESFTYDGMEYSLYDCVYMHKEGEPEPYVGKLIKMWETPNGIKEVKVLWFFRPQEMLHWLGNEETLENEIFLASGKGVGLTDVNYLEAISGKCDVVCTSKDTRNPQPSVEELEIADYIFYRTFDVGRCTIVDKIDDEVAGVDVKFIFNRKECEKDSCVSKLDPIRKEFDGKATIPKKELQFAERNPYEEFKTANIERNSNHLVAKEDADVKGSLIKHKSLFGGKTSSGAGVDSSEVDTVSVEQGSVSGDKITRKFMVDSEKDEVEVSKVLIHQVEIEEKLNSAKDSGGFNDRRSKKAKVDSSVKLSEDKNIRGDKKLRVYGTNAKPLVTAITSVKENTKFVSGKGYLGLDKGLKSAKDSVALKYWPSKKARVDSSVKLSEGKNRDSVQNLNFNSDGNNVKDLVMSASFIEKTKSRLAKDSLRLEKGPSGKQKPDEKITKLSNRISTRESPDEDNRTEDEGFELSRRPNGDKRKWFRVPPWEERVQNAHEQGTLVLLQNLDPQYTSAEVEDIVWRGFKENCTVKMIQRTAISSPHSGQAFVIFRTTEAAGRAIRKLDGGCLMLSNGRDKLFLPHIILSLTQLNIGWPWNGVYYKQDQKVGGRCYTSNKRRS